MAGGLNEVDRIAGAGARPYREISDAEVRSVLTHEMAIAAVEDALRMHAAGRAGVSQPVIQHFRCGPDGQAYRVKAGWLGPGGVSIAGIRVDASAGRAGAASGGRAQRWTIVNDFETMQPIARVEAETLNAVRVGAFAGVAARLLARPGARTVGLIGSGKLARRIAACIALTLDRPEFSVYSRTPEGAAAFAAEMGPRTGCRVEAVPSAEAACRDRDVIVTITTADEPIVKRAWLKPGSAFLDMGGRVEAEEACLLEADRVIVDEWTFCLVQGDVAPLARQGRFGRERVHAEIHELVGGRKRARDRGDEVVVAPMQGMTTLDLACAYAVYEELRRREA